MNDTAAMPAPDPSPAPPPDSHADSHADSHTGPQSGPHADSHTGPPADRPRLPLLFRVLHAEKAKSTHHKLVLDALTHLSGEQAEAWRNLFLRQIEPLLTGAKAPDKTFKDFTNHVLHVRDGLWGGAPKKVRQWYDVLTDRLSARDWPAAAYAAGVLTIIIPIR